MLVRTLMLLAILMSIACNSNQQVLTKKTTPPSEKMAQKPMKSANNEPKQSLADAAYNIILSKGLEEGLAYFEANKNKETYYIKEEEMNRVGIALVQSNRSLDGIGVFNFMEKAFPKTDIALAPATYAITKEAGIKAGVSFFEKHKKDANYQMDEWTMNKLGFTFFNEFKHQEGIAFLKMNTEAFPNSWRAFDNLGEGYLIDKQNELAVATYKKSADLNPRNGFVRMALQPYVTYSPTTLPSDTTAIFEARGDLSKDTAFVFVQGGPMMSLEIDEYDPFIHMPDKDEILRIYPYQAQMYHPEIVTAKPNMTSEQGAFEHNQSAEILYRTIAYLKARNKTVFVIGHSYGTMISLEYLQSKGNIADKHIIMGTSLDVDLRNYETKNKHGLIRWRDGTEPYETELFRGFPLKQLKGEQLDNIFGNIHNLVATHGKRRFTQILKDKDLSNLIFIHGTFDESSGRTEKYVLDFLRSKNAKIVETYGNHHSMFRESVMTNLYYYLMGIQALKQSVAATLATTIEEQGLETALSQFSNYKEANDFHPIKENEMNDLGYQLIKAKKIREAVAVFKLNAATFPSSWNVHDSLGEGYFYNEDYAMAKEQFEHSLVLNPNNTNGQEFLQKIKKLEEGK